VIALLLYVGVDVLYSSRVVCVIKERGRVWGFFVVLSPLRKVRFFSGLSGDFIGVFKWLNREFSIPRFVKI
jgi:hypothetical protein